MTAVLVGAMGVYLVTSVLLFVFGVNLTRFAVLAWRHRNDQPCEPPPLAVAPVVTVQLPIYNERYVATRLIEAVCRLDYPRDKLQIQVLDDSTDDTSTLVSQAVAGAAAKGIDIEHVRRNDRTGYKAGALAAGLGTARGELIAMFDADFVPPSDFLHRTLPHFNDAKVGFVQARWGHLNPDFSWLTKLQVPAIDSHFLVEQRSRGLGNHWFNFNGTAGVWRRDAIDDAGGWLHDTLTEDLDLSYRAHLRGWQARYLPDLVVPGELPARLTGFRRQQHRWARGSLECALKLLVPIWRSPARLGVKFQATMHLLAYTVHLLLLALLLSYPFLLVAYERFAIAGSVHGLGFVLAPASLAPAIFLIMGQLLQPPEEGRRRYRLASIAGMVVFGSGLMLNTARATVEIFTKPNPEFERTAKFGLDADDGLASQWSAPSQHRLDRIVVLEGALGLYGWATAAAAFTLGSWGVFFYATLFGTGLLAVAMATTLQSMNDRRRQRVPEPRDRDQPAPAEPQRTAIESTRR